MVEKSYCHLDRVDLRVLVVVEMRLLTNDWRIGERGLYFPMLSVDW